MISRAADCLWVGGVSVTGEELVDFLLLIESVFFFFSFFLGKVLGIEQGHTWCWVCGIARTGAGTAVAALETCVDLVRTR